MKQQTIWNIEDILDSFENVRLDLQIDYKDTETTSGRKEIIREELKRNASKIKELKDCIKWLKKITT